MKNVAAKSKFHPDPPYFGTSLPLLALTAPGASSSDHLPPGLLSVRTRTKLGGRASFSVSGSTAWNRLNFDSSTVDVGLHFFDG